MLIPDERTYSEVGRFIGNDEVVSDFTPKTADIVQAALETENVLGSLIVKEWGLPDGFISNEDFSPFDLMTDAEKDDPRFADTAMLADSAEELEAFRRQFTRETDNRRLLEDSGAMGVVAIFGAALTDPINLIPVGGMAYKTYKTGGSVLSGAMATASVATGTAAATEAGLHATQLQRTYGESVINMSAAFLLGGALGAGAKALSNRNLLSEIEGSMNVEPKIAAGQNSTIRAFHGSPYEFEKFEMGQVGTGEGAQAYGHGLYFAEAEDVARIYMDATTQMRGNKRLVTAQDDVIEPTTDTEFFASQYWGAKDEVDRLIASGDSTNEWQAIKNQIQEWENAGVQQKGLGRVYEVDIEASADELLDWNRPLSEQSAKVQGAFKELGVEAGDSGENAIWNLMRTKFSVEESVAANKDPTAREWAADQLKDKGIKGIRYKDALSKGEEGGTYNYVVFDEDLINIVTPEAEAILKEAGTDSVGAMSALGDVRITGKVAQGLAKILGWDPLSRTLTSKNPFTRRLSVKLAENPYLMDGENTTAVESVIKVKTSEYYNNAFEPHLMAFKEYRKAGGKIKRKDFNVLVSKEQRNPGTIDDPYVQKSARAWEEHTYAPLKNEAIEAKLLPDDVSRETAAQYLNRQWDAGKVAAKFDIFVQKMTAHLKQQAVRGAVLREDGAADLMARFDEFEFEDLARQIGQRLRTVRDGMLPYDYTIGEEISRMTGVSAGVKKTLSSAFKDISLNVRDADFEDFLENDIELLARNYIRRTVPDIEFTRAFDGQLDMAADQKAINDWYDGKMLAAKTDGERAKLDKQNSKDIRDVKAMNERIRGIYQGGSTIVDPDGIPARIMRTTRDLNYMRFLGGVVAASLSDVARIMMAEGLTKTFTKGLIPMIRNLKSFKVAASEAKAWGIGDEMISNNRVDILADISDYTRGATKFERTVHSFAQGFSNINMINQWNSGVKQLQAVVMQNEIVGNMINLKTDKRLVRLGISNVNQLNIGQQLKRHAQKVDGLWLANVGKWDNPELGLLYKTAMRKESDRVIVIPGQERPLFMSTELGKSLLQFRSFMMSATQRVLISAIQGQDANMMSSLMAMTTFGMMTYAFKQWDAGRPLSDDPAVWIMEGIDRSGATGILMEINNTVEKMSANSLGLRPILGITTPASRFASRNMAESLLGPSFGSFLSTTLKVAGSASADYDWTDSDTRALRRLLPYQNLSIIRQGIDALEEQL